MVRAVSHGQRPSIFTSNCAPVISRWLDAVFTDAGGIENSNVPCTRPAVADVTVSVPGTPSSVYQPTSGDVGLAAMLNPGSASSMSIVKGVGVTPGSNSNAIEKLITSPPTLIPAVMIVNGPSGPVLAKAATTFGFWSVASNAFVSRA